MKLNQWYGWGLVGLLVVLGGCESTQSTAGRTPSSFQSIRLETTDLDAVYAAGVDVMSAEFGDLDKDARERVIMIEPEVYQTRSGSGTARDYLGGVSRMRRRAWFRVDPVGAVAARARVRVDLERLDTRRGEFQRTTVQRLDDRPGYTPIQEDAATTEAQNTLWTSAGRDRALERRLLLDLQTQVEGPPAAAASATSAGDRGGAGNASADRAGKASAGSSTGESETASQDGARPVGTLEPIE